MLDKLLERIAKNDVLWTVVLIMSVEWRSSRHVGAQHRRKEVQIRGEGAIKTDKN